MVCKKYEIFFFVYSIQSVARLCHTKGRDGSAWERANAIGEDTTVERVALERNQ